MLYWIQILPPIGGATSMDFFATQIACLIAASRFHVINQPFKAEKEVRQSYVLGYKKFCFEGCGWQMAVT